LRAPSGTQELMERTTGKWLLSTETNTAPPVIPGHMKPGIAGANVPIAVNITTKKEFCRLREENQRDNTEGATKAENKKKPKKKKKAKKGIEQKDSRRESEEENSEDSDFSEEDSTKKRPMHQGRAARA